MNVQSRRHHALSALAGAPELHHHIPPAAQRLILQVATLLSSVTAIVIQVSGDPRVFYTALIQCSRGVVCAGFIYVAVEKVVLLKVRHCWVWIGFGRRPRCESCRGKGGICMTIGFGCSVEDPPNAYFDVPDTLSL